MAFPINASLSDHIGHSDYADVGQSLLIVEDHSLLAEYMAMVAEELGWKVEVAESARDFARKIEQCHPTVLALDLGLLDGDGVELLRHLSGVGYKGAILIISGCDESVLETCGRLAGLLGLRVTGHVQKPLTASVFTQLLEQSGTQESASHASTAQ
jgi:CheY-like chemotaxis protein